MKLYSPTAVINYVSKVDPSICYMVPGTLLDNYIIFHGHAVEVFGERFLNHWQSGITRHVFRKKIPSWLFGMVRGCMEYTDSQDEKDTMAEILEQLEDFKRRVTA